MSGAGFDSGYRDARDAALARVAALETELREHDAHTDHTKNEIRKRELLDRIETLSKGRRRLGAAAATVAVLVLGGIVISLARHRAHADLGQAALAIVIAALFLRGTRTPFREERALQKELDAMTRDPKRDELVQALDEARVLADSAQG